MEPRYVLAVVAVLIVMITTMAYFVSITLTVLTSLTSRHGIQLQDKQCVHKNAPSPPLRLYKDLFKQQDEV